ncbi:unnamed protein product [Phyllotreta striolata]|uniref:Uncharacterized protein n=1 Tax=Phyllotreta striolata TaxID=444603 RepID=A0A9N9XPV1_PHYSR|nr:unnamed protein product [Phyllotreta striolata]
MSKLTQSTPSSPRLLPRRLRDASSVIPPPLAAFEGLDAGGQGNSGAGNGTVNWQERCLELQLELHRSRTQATRTRDMLREKFNFFEKLACTPRIPPGGTFAPWVIYFLLDYDTDTDVKYAEPPRSEYLMSR